MTTITSDKNQSPSVLFHTSEQSGANVRTESPVFILGLMQRCGSNFLSEMLMLHSGFQVPEVLSEDYVLEHSHLLLEYVDKTCKRWRGLPWIESPEMWRNKMLRQIGDGILALLTQQIPAGKRLLAKTPAAFNVDKCLQLFPEAKLLVLVRDGRDSVESAAKKWPAEPYELWMQQWAEASRAVLDFMQGAGAASRGKSWLLVKYEDLLEKPEPTVTDILRFLGLDPSTFDWDRLKRLPLFGSSQYPDQKGDTSRVLEKPKDFNPIQRWRDWGWSRKRSFKKIAGNELISLGYAPDNQW